MIALDFITPDNPKLIYGALSKIIAVADKGSVIANDHGVSILIKLCSIKDYSHTALPLLMERLRTSPTNQLPKYAEHAMSILTTKDEAAFIKILTSRLNEFEKATKRQRVEKVIQKLQKK